MNIILTTVYEVLQLFGPFIISLNLILQDKRHHYVNFINEKTEPRCFLSDSRQEKETLKPGNLVTFNKGTNYRRVDTKQDLENSTKHGIIPLGKQQWGAVFTSTSEDTRRKQSHSPESWYTERVVGQRWWSLVAPTVTKHEEDQGRKYTGLTLLPTSNVLPICPLAQTTGSPGVRKLIL